MCTLRLDGFAQQRMALAARLALQTIATHEISISAEIDLRQLGRSRLQRQSAENKYRLARSLLIVVCRHLSGMKPEYDRFEDHMLHQDEPPRSWKCHLDLKETNRRKNPLGSVPRIALHAKTGLPDFEIVFVAIHCKPKSLSVFPKRFALCPIS
jgi:hypothetical protein